MRTAFVPEQEFGERWLGSMVVLTLLTNAGWFDADQMGFSWTLVTGRFELWRCLTAFCYAGSGFSSIVTIQMWVDMVDQVRQGKLNIVNTGRSGGKKRFRVRDGKLKVAYTGRDGGKADFVFCLLFAAGVLVLTHRLVWWSPSHFCRSMIYFAHSIHQSTDDSLRKVFWILNLVLTVLMGYPYADMVHGMLVGALFYCWADAMPITETFPGPGRHLGRIGHGRRLGRW